MKLNLYLTLCYQIITQIDVPLPILKIMLPNPVFFKLACTVPYGILCIVLYCTVFVCPLYWYRSVLS